MGVKHLVDIKIIMFHSPDSGFVLNPKCDWVTLKVGNLFVLLYYRLLYWYHYDERNDSLCRGYLNNFPCCRQVWMCHLDNVVFDAVDSLQWLTEEVCGEYVECVWWQLVYPGCHGCSAPQVCSPTRTQSLISLTQARWGCRPAVNHTHSTHSPQRASVLIPISDLWKCSADTQLF